MSEKTFPAYRAAYTKGAWKNFAFMRLFKHIKREGIPMTAPVEMDMEQHNERLKMTQMGFMYQDMKVGHLGNDGKNVEVRDVAAMKTIVYTWQGNNSSSTRKLAKDALMTRLKKDGLEADDFRILGYNGPGVANAKKTWEMLVVLPPKK